MGDDNFRQVLRAYRAAAAAAVSMGADALEIHGAHGYLLDSFLNPVVNRRDDAYGGSAETRMRFPLQVVRAVREAAGPDFPVIYRFSQWPTQDPSEIKFRSPDDLAVWVRSLREAGVDLLHVSTLEATAPAFGDSPRSLAAWTRELSGLPVIAVGRVSVGRTMDRAYGDAWDVVTDPRAAIEEVEADRVDLLAVGRALIANPDWVPLVRAGRWKDLKPFHKSLLNTLH